MSKKFHSNTLYGLKAVVEYSAGAVSVDALSVWRDIVAMKKTELLTIKLGKRLRDLRLAKGYSQEGFAEAAKIDRAGYGRIERGEVDLRLSTLERLAKTLKITMSDLLVGIDKLNK